MDARVFGGIVAVVALVILFELLRRQSIKEKYLVLWLVMAVAIVVVAIDPKIVDRLADVTGIKSGPNVLFMITALAVVLVCVHLSVEISRLEDRSRALAEEVGLLHLELEKSKRPVDQA